MTSPTQHDPEIDPARFRQVLGHFPTGVTIVACDDDGTQAGLAVGSFMSVSLDPPLIGFCPSKTSETWPHIESAGTFCVNVLAEDQEEMCRVFAGKQQDKFRHFGWRPAATGSPILDDVLAWIDCRVEGTYDAGDHHLVLGRVLELEVAREGKPLLFFRGGYGRFEG